MKECLQITVHLVILYYNFPSHNCWFTAPCYVNVSTTVYSAQFSCFYVQDPNTWLLGNAPLKRKSSPSPHLNNMQRKINNNSFKSSWYKRLVWTVTSWKNNHDAWELSVAANMTTLRMLFTKKHKIYWLFSCWRLLCVIRLTFTHRW